MKKTCTYCGVEFEAKSDSAKFCKTSHRNLYGQGYRWNPTTLKGVREHKPEKAFANTQPNTMRQNMRQTLPQLDVLGQFMVEQVKRERDKLETELKELRTKYEKIKDEKAQLEKEADQAVRKLEEKPTGLSGILQTNPQLAEQALTIGAPLLAGLAEKVMNWLDNKDPQKQLSEANPKGQGNEVYTWLVNQTPEIQKSFVMLLEGLQASGKIQDYLNAWNRSFMGARKQASATVTH